MGQEGPGRDTWKLPVMGLSCILIEVWVIQGYTFVTKKKKKISKYTHKVCVLHCKWVL